MIPGMNMNSRQMKQAMKKMGVSQDEIPAEEVIIRCADKDIIIRNPEVARVNMMGQETFQISGEAIEQEKDTTPEIEEADIITVMDQTNVSKDIATQAIVDAQGDLAQAILTLQEDD